MTAPLRVPGRPAARKEPHLKVVEVAPRSRAGAVGVIAVVFVFLTLFANAVFHSVLVTGQERLDGVNRDVATQEARNQRLRLEVAQMESPGRIVEEATANGMVLPDRTIWLTPSENGAALSSTSERATAGTEPDAEPTAPNEEAADGSGTASTSDTDTSGNR